ncbi:zona pellucida sperm-binding protein 3-like [Polyodon spathula]|uniref:zona pellucida sperm-binding protein 3-like n=1 Tax=Polyodon spathula TaxID=7913 RepID=UPI001B7E63A9|nr:zona pellucida sperm-binding protein 3-like [Polyodon spathula]
MLVFVSCVYLLPVPDNWSGHRVSNVIYLGDVLYIDASVAIDNHVPLWLHVDSCIATLSGNKDSEPRYAVVNKLGCLMDSKAPDSSSSFTRPPLNKLRFDITAFRFQEDSRSLIYVKLCKSDQILCVEQTSL